MIAYFIRKEPVLKKNLLKNKNNNLKSFTESNH